MRFFLWIGMLAVLSNADAKYVIQVLKAKEKGSITPEFMSKLNRVGMPHKVKYIDGEYRVFVGEFKDNGEAAACLNEVQEKISRDAFITTAEAEQGLQAEAKMQQMMVLAQATLLQASKQEEPASSDNLPNKEEAKTDTVDIPGPQDKVLIRKMQANTAVPVRDARESQTRSSEKTSKNLSSKETAPSLFSQETSSSLFSKETSQSLFCKPTKRALREAEISEALSFYKSSSYYTFDQGR